MEKSYWSSPISQLCSMNYPLFSIIIGSLQVDRILYSRSNDEIDDSIKLLVRTYQMPKFLIYVLSYLVSLISNVSKELIAVALKVVFRFMF